jgi:hypothetical protein
MLARLLVASAALILPQALSAQSIKSSYLVQRADRAATRGMSYHKPSPEDICLTRKSNGERVCKTRFEWRRYAATLDQNKVQ